MKPAAALLAVALPGSALIVSVLPSAAMANPPPGFDQRVEMLRRAVGVPGMAIAIVEHGRTVLARGYGVRRLGSPEPVDADTIFPNGSTGKAFTVAALATLVDQGRIRWDDRVIDRLPGFAMYDPWVTRELTIRDILVHRSGLGLGQGDLLFVPRSTISRADAVRRLRYLKPKSSFRSGYAYDNVLYMVAGQLIEAVTGQSWEDYVRDHVLRPAGMLRSTTDSPERFAQPDRAFPHARLNGGLRGIGDQQVLDEHDELARSAAPAGGMAISAHDFARWITLQLAHGALPDGRRLFSQAAQDEMWRPVVIQPIDSMPPALAATQPGFLQYAPGWEVQDYRGTRIIWHSGAVFGFKSLVVLIPQKDVGFSIQLNSEDGELGRGLMDELLDYYLGLPPAHWPEAWIAYKKALLGKALATAREVRSAPQGPGPSLPLARYVGTFHDAWYGDIAVGQRDGQLTIDFRSTPRMAGRLDHWHYDSFITRFYDPAIEPAYVTFGLDADGHVERVTMKPVSPLADFSWDYQDLLFTAESIRP
jgi:CubicO group peptidase (beta-lactamase class C family)